MRDLVGDLVGSGLRRRLRRLAGEPAAAASPPLARALSLPPPALAIASAAAFLRAGLCSKSQKEEEGRRVDERERTEKETEREREREGVRERE